MWNMALKSVLGETQFWLLSFDDNSIEAFAESHVISNLTAHLMFASNI